MIREETRCNDDDDSTLKNSSEQLKVSAKGNSILMKYSSEAIAILLENSTFVSTTAAFQSTLGYSNDELEKLTFSELVHVDDRVEIALMLHNVQENTDKSIMVRSSRVLCKDSSWLCFDVTIVATSEADFTNCILITLTRQTDDNTHLLQAFLYRLNKAIAGSADSEQLLQAICKISTETPCFDAAYIEMRSENTRQKCFFDCPETIQNFVETVIDNRIQDHVYTSATTFVSNSSLHLNSKTKVGLPFYKSVIILPIKNDGSSIGTLNLYSNSATYFTAAELSLLEEGAQSISRAIDKFQNFKSKETALKSFQATANNLQTISNSASEGFILTDLQAVIIEFNTNAEKSTINYLNKQLEVGTSIFNYLPDHRKDSYKTYFQDALLGDTIRYIHSGDSSWEITIAPFYRSDKVTAICLSFKDINAAKITETKVLESEIFNESVLSSISAHIAVINTDGVIVAVNKAWDDFAFKSGQSHLTSSSVGANYFNICKAAIASGDTYSVLALNGIVSVLDKSVGSFELEYPCNSPNEMMWFLLDVRPFGDDNTKVVISHQNITTRKIAENQLSATSTTLSKTLSELKNILEFSLDIICTVNNKREFVSMSSACHTLLGYLPDEVIGDNFIDYIFEADRDLSVQTADAIFSGGTVSQFENRVVHKNGRIVPLLWSLNWDAKLELLYCVGKDMTEKKRLEKARENEREQFYEMFAKAPAGIGMLRGATHIFEMANPLYLQYVGKQNVVGKTIKEVLPEVVEQGFVSVLDHVYETGETYSDKEVLVKIDSKNTGELVDFYINFVYQAYRDAKGQIQGVFFFVNDITEHVLARKSIEKSEKQYRQILETAQEGIWLIDDTAQTTFVNKKICDMLEYSEDEMLGKKNYLFIEENERAIAVAALERRRQGIAETFELNFVSKSGKRILTKVSANPIFDDAGNFKGSLGMVSDITEKIHLQKLLEKSNRLAQIGSWEVDVSKGTVYWSDITKEIREADADFIPDLSTGISFFTEGANKEIIKHRVQQCIENGIPWDEELQFTTFKGNLKWVRTIGEAVFNNGKCTKIYGSFQDITERKNIAIKVLRNEAKLNAAQHIAKVGSWEIDLVSNEHTWSDEFYRILGISDDVQPSTEAFMKAVLPEDTSNVLSGMTAAFQEFKDASLTFRFLRDNGEVGYASSEWKFDYAIDGNPLYIQGILRDLTKQRKDESEKLDMISDIVQRNKDLEQFSYIISHNLRAPVANIIGLTEELQDHSHLPETKAILQEAIACDVKRLEEVIIDLNVILQTKREITERKEQVNFTDLTTNITLSINDLIQNKDVTIQTDFDEVNHFNTIKSYIQSIFYNLISNSIKYRKPDQSLVIDIRTQVTDNQLWIVFTDNGSGIDLITYTPDIFGLYKRFHRGTEGKGIGLYMVKTQVETLGGEISVSSQVNQGTTFTIKLPFHL